MMESPRWLVQKRNYSKAYKVISRAAKINRQPPVDKQNLYEQFDRLQGEVNKR